jgi:hypothetical protein
MAKTHNLPHQDKTKLAQTLQMKHLDQKQIALVPKRRKAAQLLMLQLIENRKLVRKHSVLRHKIVKQIRQLTKRRLIANQKGKKNQRVTLWIQM